MQQLAEIQFDPSLPKLSVLGCFRGSLMHTLLGGVLGFHDVGPTRPQPTDGSENNMGWALFNSGTRGRTVSLKECEVL